MTKKIDLIGRRFGFWTVIDYSEYRSKSGKAHWKCKCDCGNVKNVTADALLSNRSKSCGCWRRYQSTLNLSKAHVLKRLDYLEGFVKFIMSVYRGNCKNIREFDLTFSEVKKLIFSRCYYCGSGLSNKRTFHGRYFKYNGLDRLDSSKSYTKDNVVPCCSWCNRAKLDHEAIEFVKYLERVAKYINGRGEWKV